MKHLSNNYKTICFPRYCTTCIWHNFFIFLTLTEIITIYIFQTIVLYDVWILIKLTDINTNIYYTFILMCVWYNKYILYVYIYESVLVYLYWYISTNTLILISSILEICMGSKPACVKAETFASWNILLAINIRNRVETKLRYRSWVGFLSTYWTWSHLYGWSRAACRESTRKLCIRSGRRETVWSGLSSGENGFVQSS